MLRLLAFNAEAWLAEHLNAYLAILRNLLHLCGHVDYTSNAITITLDLPERTEWPAPSNCSPKNSTPPQRSCPPTFAH